MTRHRRNAGGDIGRMPFAGALKPGRILRILAPLVVLCVAALRSSGLDASPELKAVYRNLFGEVKAENLAGTVNTLAGFGSRVAGYEGETKAAAYVEQQFRSLGLSNVHTEPFTVSVPIDNGDASISLGAAANATARMGQAPSLQPDSISASALSTQHSALDTHPSSLIPHPSTAHLYALWPNLVRTSQLPKGGLDAPLIYVGDGKLANFNGKDVEGSIVLAEFNSRAEWLNAPRLGARAVIFIEPDTTMRGEAEAKFIGIPINIPRFWIKRSEAAPFLAAAALKAPVCHVECNMAWETRQVKNVFGRIDGVDPKFKNEVIVIEGYYDSMSVVPALAPGAESACGMAAMLELARLYTLHRPARTIFFVATTAHHLALQGIREYLHKHIDELTAPSVGEIATSSDYAGRYAIGLGVLLLVSLVWLGARMRKRPEGAPVPSRIGNIAIAALALVAVGVNAGFWSTAHAQPLRQRDQIYLWAGLDLTSQTRGVGIFYKSWFYDIREDIQGRFSDIGRVCRENAEKIGNAVGFDNKRVFADGINPVDGKNWRNYIPGKPAFDSEVATMAQANGVTFASIDDARNLVDTPFDTPDKVNIANLTFQTKLLACEFYNILNDTNEPGDVNAQRMPITEPSKWSRMALQGGFASLSGHVAIFRPRKSYFAFPDP